MPHRSKETLTSFVDLFGLLSDRTRLRLVLMVAKGERNVISLCEELEMPQSTVSHHLGLLRMNGLIVGKREGKQVIYSLTSNAKAAGGKLKISLPPYSVTVEGY